ncbi:hypothetical protein F6V30_07590 [Oryzomonas sagensis]|uniref:Uncharacterized protein n=1 Tax=Oryzomonas sagensis TaxID=2603857 RepID=A0ABQ6TU18_9BACT|nr:hypothetical protein [Oryzomonas sagensis]KAB0672415.1 hypothetical protein F6V30_07590 [Oryzomonas sagensis]
MTRTQVTLTIALVLSGFTTAHASDTCRVTEYPDRIEASCMGNPAPAPAPPEASAAPVAAPTVEAVPKEPAAVVSSVPSAHSGFAEPAPDSPLPQTTGGRQQRRMATDTMENAKAARLQKIMNSRP